MSLLSNAISTDVITVIFIFQYTFFIASLINRFSNFVENFERSIVSKVDGNLIKALDDFTCCYTTFETLIERINSIFRLQVIDQFMV